MVYQIIINLWHRQSKLTERHESILNMNHNFSSNYVYDHLRLLLIIKVSIFVNNMSKRTSTQVIISIASKLMKGNEELLVVPVGRISENKSLDLLHVICSIARVSKLVGSHSLLPYACLSDRSISSFLFCLGCFLHINCVSSVWLKLRLHMQLGW